MKKKLLLLICLVAIVCFSVPAYALNKAVTIDSASATKTTVVVKGTTEALAVTMQLRDDSDNIIAMITAGTNSGAFDISLNNLSLTPGTSYTVYVADYEGGNWTTEVVTVSGYDIVVTNDGNGTATSNVAAAGAGTTITLTATPKDGYVFKAWEVVSGSITLADKNAASTTFVMPSSDVEVKATFEKDAATTEDGYNIVVVNDGNGTATSNITAAGAGTTITLIATPKDGYVFKAWEVVSGSITLADKNAASTTFVMPSSDVEVKATFEKDAAAGDTSKDPTDKTNSGSVKTGDNAAFTAAIIILVASLLGFVILLMKKRRTNL